MRKFTSPKKLFVAYLTANTECKLLTWLGDFIRNKRPLVQPFVHKFILHYKAGTIYTTLRRPKFGIKMLQLWPSDHLLERTWLNWHFCEPWFALIYSFHDHLLNESFYDVVLLSRVFECSKCLIAKMTFVFFFLNLTWIGLHLVPENYNR